MRTELHKLCKFATPVLHGSFSDFDKRLGYLGAMSTKDEAGKRIKLAREALGLTLEGVCARVDGLTVSRLSNWEHGRNMIGVDEAKKLAPALGVSAAYILTIDLYPTDAIARVASVMQAMEPAQQYKAAQMVDLLAQPAPANEPSSDGQDKKRSAGGQ